MPAKTRADRTKSRVPTSALALLESARLGLEGCQNDPSAVSRLVASQLAALRTAAAVVAARSDPRTTPRNEGPQSVWDLLPSVAPAFSEWAAYFAVNPSHRRETIRARWHRASLRREADEFLRNAETFFALAADTLGVAEVLRVVTPLPDSTPNRAVMQRMESSRWASLWQPERSREAQRSGSQ
jgi:hypothetical protein